jgi:hypothetical protein
MKLWEKKASLRVILCSGHNSEFVCPAAGIPPDICFLRKRYAMADLAREIRTQLDEDPSLTISEHPGKSPGAMPAT